MFFKTGFCGLADQKGGREQDEFRIQEKRAEKISPPSDA